MPTDFRLLADILKQLNVEFGRTTDRSQRTVLLEEMTSLLHEMDSIVKRHVADNRAEQAAHND